MTRHATRQVDERRKLFAANLKAAQAAKGFTNEALAHEAVVPLRLLQRWRAGGGEPSGPYFASLCATLDRPAEWFYADRSDEPEPVEAA